MDVLPLLDRAYAEMIEVAAKVMPDDLDRRTPCSEWDVRALLNHALWSSARLSQATVGQSGPTPGEDLVGDNPAASVATRLPAALELWHRPGALESTVSLPIGDLPGIFAASISLVDVYTHRWDLARAVGGDAELDPELAETCLTFARGFISDELRAKVGFGPPIEPAPGASPGDQLVAFLGRQP
jgi:uncharacterized protein (TIGR03086 family)